MAKREAVRRLHCPIALTTGSQLALPESAARHVQVWRLQPGDVVCLFQGRAADGWAGGEFEAVIERMGRSEVVVQVGAHRAVEREARQPVHLAVGMPANDRMDWLIEKATELGVASLQPLHTERSVLRLAGERALKRQAHWLGVAAAACEQCGRNTLPEVHLALPLADWLGSLPQHPDDCQRLVLSTEPEAQPWSHAQLRQPPHTKVPVLLLSGPEGGLSAAEMALARAAGFTDISLGARVLRADTAPLAALSALVLA